MHREVDQMSKQNTLSAEQALKHAAKALKNSDTEKAEKYYNAVLKKYPDNQEAISGLKKIYPNSLLRSDINELRVAYKEGKFREVEVRTKMYLDIYPDVPALLNLLAVSLADQKKFDEAVPYFEQMVELNSLSAAAHFNLANIKKAVSDFDGAIKSYKTTIELSRDHTAAYNNLGNLYRMLGQFDLAVEYLSTIARRFPNNAEIIYNAGAAYYGQGNYVDALPHFQKVISLDLNNKRAHLDIAVCLRNLKQFDEAKNYFVMVIEAIPDFLDAYNNFGSMLIELGEFTEAEKILQHACELAPDAWIPYNNLASLNRETGEFDRAIKCLERGLSIKPNSIEMINNRADVLKAKGDYIGAIEQYEAIYNMIPTAPVCIANLAILSFLVGDDKASEKYTTLLDDIFIENIGDQDKREFCAAYKSCLVELAKVNKKAKRDLKEDTKNLWVIGSGTVLPLKGHQIKLNGKKLIANTKWVTGAKAYHLGQDGFNQYKASVQHHLMTMKKDTNILFMFGAIDCQLQEGILLATKKTKSKLSDVVSKTVASYFENTYEMATAAKVIPSYCAVAAPFIDKDVDGAADLVKATKQFNDELKSLCDAKKLVFIDTYSKTDAGKGLADGSKHIDRNYLKPSTLIEAING